MGLLDLPYARIWLADFEFTALPGELPTPLCVVAKELRSGKLVKLWLADDPPGMAPYDMGPDSLFVAFFASAEFGCHLALDWILPVRILDLYVEFKCLTSGLSVPCGKGLLGAMAYFGLDGLTSAEKKEMRELAIRGGSYSPTERQALLEYCQTDVDGLARLLPKMLPKIDLPRALLRGRFMAAIARMEWTGVPIDLEALDRIREGWMRIKSQLIQAVDGDYGVFQPTGQRKLNFQTTLGAAILAEAKEWNLNPYDLSDAVELVWQTEKEAMADSKDARQAARQATGLNANRIDRWERSGQDYSSYSGLDVMARELAGSYPALGIGQGYDPEAPDEDYSGRLWDILREPAEKTKPRHHPDIIRQAAEMVAAHPQQQYYGPMSFSTELWAKYVESKGIPWPERSTGGLALDDDTFGEMAKAFPAEVGPIRELRHSLSQLRLQKLTVGQDGRNRCLLSPFSSRTGRNQPSNAKFIFGPSCWARSLIRPEQGRAVAYVDYSQQELAIAAYLSGDTAMQNAYRSGDFYLTFAKRAGAVPPEATKETHGAVRDQFKTASLGVLFGLGADGLARKLGVQSCRGRELLQMHREAFPQFWQWSDLIEMTGMLSGRLHTVFGWPVHVGPKANPRSLRNFPMQANGAEMLRLACCLATERGIQVNAPIHDALLVEGPADEIEDVVTRTQEAMTEASELVLPGFPMRTEAKIVRYPDRYTDPRGERMWRTVWRLLEAEDWSETPCTHAPTLNKCTPCTDAGGPHAPMHPPSILISSLNNYVPLGTHP